MKSQKLSNMIGSFIDNQKKEIKKFLETQNIRNYTFHLEDSLIPEVIVDVQGSITITRDDLDEYGHIPFKFGKVSGSFICNDCGLTSLTNAPIEVGDKFCCSGNKLENLRGCPGKVGVSFECENNSVDFPEEVILENCKVGKKVKTYLIKPARVFEVGCGNYPTKTTIDKFRFTTFDGVGLCISFHVCSSYLKKKSPIFNVSYWTQYAIGQNSPKTNGLEYLSKDICDRFSQFIQDRIDTLLKSFHFDDIDWNNWDIPTSEKEMIEGGFSSLDISIPDHPSLKMEKMKPFVGDCWVGGKPIFELIIKQAFYK